MASGVEREVAAEAVLPDGADVASGSALFTNGQHGAVEDGLTVQDHGWPRDERLKMLGSASNVEAFQPRDMPGDLDEPVSEDGMLRKQHAVLLVHD
eukprot:689482-Heterocapsa_arctica.AAC.1